MSDRKSMSMAQRVIALWRRVGGRGEESLELSAARIRDGGSGKVGPVLESERKPFVRRGLWTTSLQFTDTEAQSRMLTFRPQALLIGYTRSMMGFIRLNPAPDRIAMIGLGGGSLAKYCYRHLPQSSIDVVEINPHVLQLRRTFKVPADDKRFRVLLDDGALFIRKNPQHYDVLLVDGYDASGIPPALASQRFYNDCLGALRPGGVLVVNLFCDDGDRHVQRLRHAFADAVISVAQPGKNHCIAIAWLEPLPTSTPQTLLSAAAQRDLSSELDSVDRALSDRQAQQLKKKKQSGRARSNTTTSDVGRE